MHNGYSIEIGIAASIGTALLVGAVNGVLIAYVGIPPFVVTLAMLSFARSLAMVASNNTVVFQFGPDHGKLLYLGGGAFLFGISNPVIYTIVLALITGFTLRWTRFRALRLRYRRKREGGDLDGRTGAAGQARGLYDLGAFSRHRRNHRKRDGSAR